MMTKTMMKMKIPKQMIIVMLMMPPVLVAVTTSDTNASFHFVVLGEVDVSLGTYFVWRTEMLFFEEGLSIQFQLS